LNGKECDPQEFLRREDHDRNCPAMQEWWRQHFAEFMSDSKDDRKKLWQRTDAEKNINFTGDKTITFTGDKTITFIP
jgi:hypothetical protein